VQKRTALARQGEPDDIAGTVLWLLTAAPYVTGQVLAVDGGRNLSI
jgi:pteridine reductase